MGEIFKFLVDNGKLIADNLILFLVISAGAGFAGFRLSGLTRGRGAPKVGPSGAQNPGLQERAMIPLPTGASDADHGSRPLIWPYKEVFPVQRASAFYDKVAAGYDARNSTELLETHRRVTDEIKSVLSDPDKAYSVLDLGCGTGQLIATHFYDRGHVSWVGVDISAEMLDAFDDNLRSTALGVSSRREDMLDAIPAFKPASFEVVLLSCVLSSMPADPDFGAIRRLLKAGGLLIVADIDPAYTALHPHYAVRVEGEVFALEARPVNQAALTNRVLKAGFALESTSPVVKRGTPYAFVSSYRNK